jgi:carbon monoxide dehydrogenase subunit G
MNKLLTMTAALALLVPLAASAHGPPRKKVTETVDLSAPPEKVWQIIGNFQNMAWHPAVQSTEGKGGNTPDSATRKLTLKGGGVIEEELAKFEADKMSYSYRITNVDVKVLPVTNYASTISVLPGDNGGSKVEWRGAFYRGYPNNDPPADLNDDAAIKAVTGVYRAGLDALKASLGKSGS